MQIQNYKFEGPYYSTDGIYDSGGIYVILDHRTDGEYYVVDVGQSGSIRTRLAAHDRQSCWLQSRQGELSYWVLYTPRWTEEQRMLLEGNIRAQFNPKCGVN